MTTEPEPRTGVPRLTITQDNEFFFTAAREGRLEIQRCTDCLTLRHPPAPACPSCQSFDWDTVESSRRGTLHSWTVIAHPPDPAFTYPLAVGLLDLEEGTRLVADIAGVDHADLEIGMELEVGFSEHAHGETLPQLRRRGGAA
ncbi:MAG: OB-fold domain-containing protein [Jatrophihabitans sp.]